MLHVGLRLESRATLEFNLVNEGSAENPSTQWLMFALARVGNYCNFFACCDLMLTLRCSPLAELIVMRCYWLPGAVLLARVHAANDLVELNRG